MREQKDNTRGEMVEIIMDPQCDINIILVFVNVHWISMQGSIFMCKMRN